MSKLDIIKKIAQSLGKSEDEVVEFIGKKAGKTGEEVSEQAVISNLQKEARDASVPVGSGKNLDALQNAQDDIAKSTQSAADNAKLQQMQKDAKNAPFVDSERGINSENLGLSYDDAPAAQYKVPASNAKNGKFESIDRPSSLANTAKALEGSVDPMAKKQMNLKQIAALLGLTAGGTMMLGGEDEAPMTPQELAKQSTPAPQMPNFNAAAQAEANEQSMGIPAAQVVQVAAPQEIAPVEDTSYEDELRQAQDASSKNTFFNTLLRAGNQAGASIASLGAGSQVKPDYSGVDALTASAGQPVKDVKERFGAKKESQAYQKAKDELNDEAKLRDPNSEVSRLTSELAAKAGLVKPGTQMSAMALKSSGVNLGTLLSTIEAGKARKEAASMAREARTADTNERIQAKAKEEDLKRTDKRKLITEEVEDRYRNINDSLDTLDTLVDKYGTSEVFGSQNEDMNRLLDTIATDMAKYTDPNSVARPSEVQLWRRNLVNVGPIAGYGTANSTARDIIKNFKGEVEKRRTHAYKVRGISPDESSSAQPTQDNNSEKKQVVNKQYSKSRDQTKYIYSDGSEETVDGQK